MGVQELSGHADGGPGRWRPMPQRMRTAAWTLGLALVVLSLGQTHAQAADVTQAGIDGTRLNVFKVVGGCETNGCRVRPSRKISVNNMTKIDICIMVGQHECDGAHHTYLNDSGYDGWVVFDEVPDTTITSGPGAVTSSATSTFTFTSTVAGVVFYCDVAGDIPNVCTSPWVTRSLRPGSYTAHVYAMTYSGVADPTPATYDFTVVSGP